MLTAYKNTKFGGARTANEPYVFKCSYELNLNICLCL